MKKLEVGDRVIARRDFMCDFKGEITGIFFKKINFCDDPFLSPYQRVCFIIEDGFYSSHDECPFYEHELTRLVKKRKKHA